MRLTLCEEFVNVVEGFYVQMEGEAVKSPRLNGHDCMQRSGGRVQAYAV